MKRLLLFVLLLLLALAGCGGGTKANFVAPESARTPDGARPLSLTVSPPLTLASGEKTINAAGLNLVGGLEGFSPCPYRDVVGVWTIGYGVTSGSGIFVGPHTRCESRATGLAQLATLVRTRYEPAVHAVSSTFGQNAVNALDSFDYNLGAGIFTGTLRVDLERHAYQAAGNIMLQYDHAGGAVIAGLRTRRETEVRVLRTPDVSRPKPKPLTRRQLEQRIRVLRADLTRRHCRTVHGRRAYHLCPRWAREGQQAHRELNRLKR